MEHLRVPADMKVLEKVKRLVGKAGECDISESEEIQGEIVQLA